MKNKTKSKSELENILNTFPIHIASIDISGKYVSWNKASEDMFGFTAEEVIGTLTPRRFHRNDEEARAVIDTAEREGKFDDEVIFIRRDGSEFPVHLLVTKTTDSSGNHIGFTGVAVYITKRKQVEEDRQAQLRVLKHMDQINHIIQDTTDLNQLLKDVMNAVMEIFESDRAWLLYPCDPDHPTYRVPAECSRPEYPGAFILNEDIPMKPGTDDVCRAVLASADPVPYGPAFEHKIYPELTSQFGVQAQLVTAIYPMTGKPWMFGIHQCSHARKWTPQDIHLFKDIGRRLADGLSSMLFLSELQKSEEKFRYFVKNSNDIFVLIDENGKEIFVSDSVELITGFTPAETMGHSGFEFLHPDDINHMSKTLSKLLETPGGTIRDEYRHRRKGGGWIHLEAKGTNYLHEPLVGGIILNVRDITERKQAEEELKKRTGQLANGEKKLQKLYRESEDSRKSLMSILEDVTEKEQALRKSEERFKTVADFTYSWEYWIDLKSNFIYISPSCERISGYKPEEFYKDPELLEKIIHPDDKKKVINHRKFESDSKKVGGMDFRIITRNGDIRYIGHVCRSVYGKDGKYLGRRATNRDITDSKREETIRQMMYQISNAVNTTKDLNEFFKVIHLELGKVLKTKNFYIALYNKETDTLSLPYFIDEKDNFKSFPARKTLTAYVIKNNKPIILTEKEIKNLISSGVIEAVGTISKIWLGVPLISKEEVKGVLVVQSYENEKDYNKKDLELLKFISGQIGLSIERKQTEDLIHIQRDLALKLNEVKGLDETLRLSLDSAIKISEMDCGGIYLVNESTGNIDLAYHKGLPADFVKSVSHYNADSNNARMIMAGKPVYSQHKKLGVDLNGAREKENLGAIAVIPILHESKVIACLNIASHNLDEVPSFSREALQTISAQIGSVIARLNTREELQASEEKYRQVFDNSLVGNYISQNYILKFCNQQLAEIFGYDNAEVMLKKDMREIIISESREFEYSELKLRKYNEKDFSRYEFKGIKKDGSLINIEVLGGHILYQGKPAMQGTLIDITERKKHEQKLKIALEKAKESDRLKSVFLTTMSHELRTPLNAIIGFSELIDESLPISVINDFSKTICDSGTHLLNIIEDIFDISTLETGDMKVIKEKFSLNKAIKEISDSIKAELKKEKKENLDTYYYPDKKNQDTIIYTDRHKLKQIMINLLKNAVKFTLEGHIEYGYEIEDEENILFFVKDTGVGIPKDKQEIIFNRFRQADDSHTRKFGGTGLGLAIVKNLVEILGGKIWLNSDTEKGSEFYFTLPCNIAVDSIKKTSETDIDKTGIDLSGKIILVVDDVESVYLYMKAVFRKTNVQLIWAKDGQEAIDICKENKNISLVLMDIQMPVLNGLEATKHIKQFRKDLPIIAQTAYALKGDREMSLNAGCDDYISKPIDTKVLFTTIEKYI